MRITLLPVLLLAACSQSASQNPRNAPATQDSANQTQAQPATGAAADNGLGAEDRRQRDYARGYRDCWKGQRDSRERSIDYAQGCMHARDTPEYSREAMNRIREDDGANAAR